MLAVEGVTSRYGRVEALHGVSLEVATGEIVTLVGSNGAGKTTLLKAISGVQPVAAGTIRFDGETIDRLPPHGRVARGIAQVPEGRQVFAPLTVADNLRLGGWTRSDPDRGTSSPAARRASRSASRSSTTSPTCRCSSRDGPAVSVSAMNWSPRSIQAIVARRPRMVSWKYRPYHASASSRSRTSNATWLMPIARTIGVLQSIRAFDAT